MKSHNYIDGQSVRLSRYNNREELTARHALTECQHHMVPDRFHHLNCARKLIVIQFGHCSCECAIDKMPHNGKS